jgi:hypothetical protein
VLLVSAISVCFDFDMSAKGPSRRFDWTTATSGLPRGTDIFGIGLHVSKVPTGDINCGDCDVRSLAEPEPDRRAFAKFKHLLRKAAARSRRNHLRHNRRNPPSIYAHRMRQLFSTLCPILKASCSSLRPARARPAARRRGPLRPLPHPPRSLRLHWDLGAASCCP